MGIHICDNGEGTAYLFDSCSGRPINTTSFSDTEEADKFIELCDARNVTIGNADAETLDRLQDELRALPHCRDCGDIVVFPSDGARDQCQDCAEWEAYDKDCERSRAEYREAHPLDGLDGIADKMQEAVRACGKPS